MSLRKKVNKDLERSMEGTKEWGLPVVLISPDGVTYDKKFDAEIVDTPLTGQVLHNRTEFNPDTGEPMIIDDPVVVLRLNSLERVPAQTEKWAVKIPESPDPEAPLVTYTQSPDKAMEFNRSFGFVRMYLIRMAQV